MKTITFEQLPNAVELLRNEVSELKTLLIQKNESNSKVDELLNVQQTSKLLGLSIPTIYSYTHQNKIPFNKKGKKLIFLKSEIMNWVKSGRKKTEEEVQAETDNFLANVKK